MKIGFKFGPTPNKSEPYLDLGAMTLIVGPNGAGKSLLLREIFDSGVPIYQVLGGKANNRNNKLLGSLHADRPRPAQERRWRERTSAVLAHRIGAFARYYMPASGRPNLAALECAEQLVADFEDRFYERESIDTFDVDMFDARALVRRELRERIEGAGEMSFKTLAESFLDESLVSRAGIAQLSFSLSTLSSRVKTLEPRAPHPPEESPKHALMRLLQDRDLRTEVNEVLAKLADFELAVDASNLLLLRVVSYTAGGEPPPESAPWSDDSKRFLAQTRPLEERCDGDRSLAALVVESLLLDTDVLLLDEPEISLHPPLARQLGAHLTDLAEKRGISIIAATHSPDFVAGCLSTRHPVSICRLDYRDGRGSALALSTELVSEMSADPLLRSTGILGALFHKAALVCEGASDVALYGEISDRLSLHEQDYPRVMRDTLMINANGRTSVPKIIARLRAAGVHCACITDLDLLNVNNVLEALLRATDVHESLVQSLVAMSDQVSKIFSDRKSLLKQGGASSLPKREAEVVKTFTDTLARFGIFVPENGALEQWLPQFTEIPRGKRSKANFIPSIFEALGPTTTGLAPAGDDIWAFMRRVAAWLADTTPTTPTDERSPDHAR